jgi:hypothetical protein
MNSKESLLKIFTNGQIHLSKKDYGFFSNIQVFVKDKKPITTNQTRLFDKLIEKYQRQLTKNGYDIKKLLDLPWHIDVVETSTEYTTPKIFITNQKIIIKCPFNTNFISEIRKDPLSLFVWDKNDRNYVSEFSTYAFKKAVTLVTKHYENVQFCEESERLLGIVNSYEECKYWDPILVQINKKYYVLSCNSHVYELVKDLDLSNDPKTLFTLSKYGVKIHPKIIENDKFLSFAANYKSDIDLDKFELLCNWLKVLQVNVKFSREVLYNKQISKELKTMLTTYDIPYFGHTDDVDLPCVILQTNTFVPNYDNADKIVTLKNSRPIIVK